MFHFENKCEMSLQREGWNRSTKRIKEQTHTHKKTLWFCHPCSSPMSILCTAPHFFSSNLNWFPLLKNGVLNSNIAESAEGQLISHLLGYSGQNKEKEGRKRRMGRHQGSWKEKRTEVKGGRGRREGGMRGGLFSICAIYSHNPSNIPFCSSVGKGIDSWPRSAALCMCPRTMKLVGD